MRVLTRDGRRGLDEAFVALPHVIYADDPLWIPEEEEALRRAFSDGNEWFALGRAVTFSVAGRARLAVFRREDCVVDGRPAACFGYMESVDDGAALDALLALAQDWARAEGAEILYGPIDFDTLGRYRLRTGTERPDAMPFPGEPYGRECYPSLLERARFRVARSYVSQLSLGALRPDEGKRAAADALLASGYMIEPLDGATWMSLLPELHPRVNEIFADAFAYTPVSFARFTATHGAGLARRLCPRASVVARAPGGELAGFLLVFPHYGPLVVQGSAPGRVAASALSYEEHAPLLAARGERVGIVKTVGIAPAHRRRGVMDALVVATLEAGWQHYDTWLGALIRSDNPSGRYGAARERMERAYSLFARPLHDGAPTGEST
jgi:GNAT superfamily N-acetyltransferase